MIPIVVNMFCTTETKNAVKIQAWLCIKLPTLIQWNGFIFGGWENIWNKLYVLMSLYFLTLTAKVDHKITLAYFNTKFHIGLGP